MIKVIVLSPHTFSMASIIIQTKLVCAAPDLASPDYWGVKPSGQH